MANTDTYTVTGSWVAPANITSVDVECWAGGASGAVASAPFGATGGGGGAYSRTSNYTVVPGNTYTVTVGLGGVAVTGSTITQNGNDGGDSWFDSIAGVLAKGGGGGQKGSTGTVAGGAGGLASGGVGTTKFSGGSGGTMNNTINFHTGGGSSAGTAANGNNGTANSNTAGAAPTGGGAGGDGAGSTGFAGSIPGGGGGSAQVGSGPIASGAGARGEVHLTYATILTTTTSETVTTTETSFQQIAFVLSEIVSLSDFITAVRTIFANITKTVTSWASGGTKSSTTFSNQSKNSGSWTNQNKS